MEESLNLFTRTDTRVEVLEGDCLDRLREMEDESVEAVVTDPPAGISFMNAEWDSNKGSRNQWIAWLTEVMEEILRVTKPGGHALVWALPRTSHWTAMALEDAGWEVRDRVTHHFGSGFPKSANISKQIDKMAGAERETWEVPRRGGPGGKTPHIQQINGERKSGVGLASAPATDAAKQWDGYGTALKPSTEDWWLCRKPLAESSIARNVLEHGCGGLNIDGCRVGSGGTHGGGSKMSSSGKTLNQFGEYEGDGFKTSQQGRWPSNLLLSHSPECVRVGEKHEGAEGCPCKAMDEMSGVSKSPKPYEYNGKKSGGFTNGDIGQGIGHDREFGDSGGASRFFAQFHEPDTGAGFFYCPKSSRAERNRGLEGMPASPTIDYMSDTLRQGNGRRVGRSMQNSHPTVKSVKLMRYLVRLVCPPEGTVLDPFTGSGSTGVAAVHEGFDFVGIEAEPEYAEIARRRIADALENPEV